MLSAKNKEKECDVLLDSETDAIWLSVSDVELLSWDADVEIESERDATTESKSDVESIFETESESDSTTELLFDSDNEVFWDWLHLLINYLK